MSDLRVNDRIVTVLTKHCGGDLGLRDLVLNIVWAETKNQFRFKEFYRDEIEKLIVKRGRPSAN